jgi:hypothetical protein
MIPMASQNWNDWRPNETILAIASSLICLIAGVCPGLAAGTMLVSDTNPTLAVNAFGGAANGTVLKLVNNCTPDNTDCTWSFRNGMLVSDSNPSLAINAFGGAANGTALKLVNNCTPDNSDCTWSFRNGMLVSDTNPGLAINAFGGAANGTMLKLVNNCTPNLTDCTWTYRIGMLLSDTNWGLAVNAYGGAANGTALKLTNNCTPNLTDCAWTYQKGMLLSDTNSGLAVNAYGGAANGTALKLANNCAPNLTDCTWTYRKGMFLSDTNSGLTMNAYGGAANGTALKLVNNCTQNLTDCTWTYTGPPSSRMDVTTYHYDNLRTGWNAREFLLTSANVATSSFGLVTAPVQLDDQVDAQPLIVLGQNITTTGCAQVHSSPASPGRYDVAYVATEGNTIYAIDANTGTILLCRNFGAPVPEEYLGKQNPSSSTWLCTNNGPRVGINGTAVIDRARNTMYVIVYTLEAGHQVYRIHALDLSTLNDRVASREITASHLLSDGTTVFPFSPASERQRAALVESSGNVYAAFGTFCDDEAAKYGNEPRNGRGWLLGWNAGTLNPLPANELTDKRSTAANSNNFFLSGIWMSGYGIAADDAGNLYFTTGNSDCTTDFPCSANFIDTYDGVLNIQNSVVKLPSDLSRVTDLFTPSNVRSLDAADLDFSSGGVLLLPPQFQAFPQPSPPPLAVATGKDGHMFLLNGSQLGGYTAGGPDKAEDVVSIGTDCWCGPSYFGDGANGYVVSSGSSTLTVWQAQPILPFTPQFWLAMKGSYTLPGSQQDGGFFTSVSSNADRDAIIWAVSRPAGNNDTSVKLYAFGVGPPSVGSALTPLLNAPLVAGHWDNLDANANIIPVVTNGHVYVASDQQLSIFGLRAPGAPVVATRETMGPPGASAAEASRREISGTVLSVSGQLLTLETRTGKTVTVDLGGPLPEGISLKGRPIHAVGSYDANDILHAATINRVKKSPAYWPPDR